MSKSTTKQIINKSSIAGATLNDALNWIFANIGGGGGSGDVVGPGVAVSGNIAIFNGTTGKLIMDSGFAPGAFAITARGLPPGGTAGQILAKIDGTDYNVQWVSGGGGGVTDHGALTGLGDDDHTQYHNDARGDARYSQLGHTHALATGSIDGFMSSANFTKLAGIAAGATANSADAFLLARANHTGTQAQSTIVDLVTDLAGKEPTIAAAGGTPTAQYWRGGKVWADFATSVRAALLTGFASGPNSAVAATDTVLQAIQKLQAQISAGGGGGGATIKGIQRGTITIATVTASATATITSVAPAKTELRFLGGSGSNSSSAQQIPRIVLTNATTITATLATNSSGATNLSWELTEYN